MAAGESEDGQECGGTEDCLPGLICLPRGLSGACAAAGSRDIGKTCETTADCYAGLNCNVNPLQPGDDKTCLAGLIGLPQPWAGVTCEEEDPGPFRAYFEIPDDEVIEFYRLPYPNDIRIKNGRPDLSGHPTPGPGIVGFDIVETYIDAAQTNQDRFGLNAPVFFRFSKSLNFDTVSVQENQNIFLMNIDPNSPDYGKPSSLRWAGSSGGNKYICQNYALIRPLWGQPLSPNTTYAAVLLNTIKDQDGTPLGRDEDFQAMMSDTRPADPAGDAWDRYEPLRAWLKDDTAMPPTAGNVAVASVFTTGTPTAEAQTLAGLARAEAATESELTLCDGQVTSPCDDGLTGDEHKRGCFDVSDTFHEVQGKLSLPIFQEGTAPYLDDGGATLDSVQRREDVCMAMTVPKVTMPAAGWPVILYAHGTGGNARSSVRDIGDLVTSIDIDGTPVNFVTIGWEQVQHFTRRGESDRHPNELVYNFANPDAAKGNFLQGAADIHAIIAWLETLNLASEASPTGEAFMIDPTQIYFFGHSQGGTTGPLALAFDSVTKGAVLSGAGGGLTLALMGKTKPVNSPVAVKIALQDADANINHPVLGIIQSYFDPVDPINFAASMAAAPIADTTYPMHIFQTNGIGDTFTPPTGMDALAIALRATYIEPVIDTINRVPTAAAPFSGNVTHNMVPYTVAGRQYTPDGYDGHFVAFRNAQAQSDISTFFGTAVASGVAEVR